MKDICIVTAIVDINRETYEVKNLARSIDQYFDYFAFWAQIKNQLIVYTESRFADRIRKIREDFHLGDKTKIIEVDQIFDIESDIYQRMIQVQNNPDFRRFRFYPQALENQANYDYVMLMKYWCMMDAVKQLDPESTVAWLDFGFNHGGKTYVNMDEFNYEWRYSFEDKIHLFCLKDPDTFSVIQTVEFLSDVVAGPLVVAPAHLCSALWDLVKEAMVSLLSMECIDDDQLLLLMAYKMKPELFSIHLCEWFLPLKLFGGGHLTTRNEIQPSAFKVKAWIKRWIIVCLASLAKRKEERRHIKRQRMLYKKYRS